ncbi:TOPRS ligase, partial [Anseranas semipalmata]|nr:TOPRS ligase [Anseranas semipalmata]
WTCPACGDRWDDVAYLTPCLHQLCYGCALRWARRRPSCPLCREAIETIRYSVRSAEDYLEVAVPEPAEHLQDGQQDEQGTAEPVLRAPELGFPPEVWAAFFRENPENVEPLLPWLQQEVELMSGTEWWEVLAGQSTVVGFLCLYGLDQQDLVRALRPCLKNQTVPFVGRLIAAAVELCSTEIRRQQDRQDARAAGGQEDSPAATCGHATSPRGTHGPGAGCSTSPAGLSAEELPGILGGGPGHPPSTPVATEEEQEPPEELGQAAAAAASAQGRERLPGGLRRAPKRRASSAPQDSPQPRKRPPRRR